jgi:RNA-directed DNA polymerase
MLHAWSKFGIEAAEREYLDKYKIQDRLPHKEEINFQQVIQGKINFIGMVKGKNDPIYRKYLTFYNQLISRM